MNGAGCKAPLAGAVLAVVRPGGWSRPAISEERPEARLDRDPTDGPEIMTRSQIAVATAAVTPAPALSWILLHVDSEEHDDDHDHADEDDDDD